jgi:hypothetical protein
MLLKSGRISSLEPGFCGVEPLVSTTVQKAAFSFDSISLGIFSNISFIYVSPLQTFSHQPSAFSFYLLADG